MSFDQNYTDNQTGINRNTMSVADLTEIAVFTAIIAVLTQLSIPMPSGVPMTLQTLIIPVGGILLGRKKGTYATLLYLLIGAVGLPVFSGFTGGIGRLFDLTGGFLISFPILSYTAGLGYSSGLKRSRSTSGNKLIFNLYLVAGLLIGATINYAFGTVWFMLATGSDFVYAFTACVLPFIPTSLIKIALAAILGPELKKRLSRIIR